ncbi:MAG: AsmA family protein, partial [Muribaculaceae bacterium]|nr:AsmA family protein [Muribaculaceae bacterium]
MSDSNVKKSKKPLWIKVLKIAGWMVAGIVALIVAAISFVVWILTPEQLTPIVEDNVNKMIDGQAKISRVELTFWHTFPRLTLDVDSLELTSNSLKTLPDSVATKLPNDADSLLSIGRFHGGINLADLMIG